MNHSHVFEAWRESGPVYCDTFSVHMHNYPYQQSVKDERIARSFLNLSKSYKKQWQCKADSSIQKSAESRAGNDSSSDFWKVVEL